MVTKKIIVKGKVQRVFYRQSARIKAKETGITGTVENLDDGNTVVIIATGNDAQINTFIEWCKQGPPAAEVKEIEIVALPLQEFGNFSIL
ncbi:MAG TPA: acylphosphatase [Niabella sp.]|nr:acylphosphatase [Niabella sp.]